MELRVLFVVVFVHASFVLASPHGYGIKGGAAAKADAGAAAGAFGGLSGLPTGSSLNGGFSGSFSKSSASSFAASSASSGSYSFSGSGIPGSIGCTTGSCGGSTSGNSDANTYSNLPNTGYNRNFNGVQSGAAAGAIAQAGAVGHSQSPPCIGNNCPHKNQECTGSNCNDATSYKKCESGECHLPSLTKPSSYDNNCASGQCGTTLESGPKPYNANYNTDINNPNKCQAGQCGPNSSTGNCAGGICSPSHNSNTYTDAIPTSNSSPSVSYHGNTDKCSSGQCNPSQSGKHSNPADVADILVNVDKNSNPKSTDNQSQDCASGNCAFNSKPSYPLNIPTSSTIDNSKCSSPGCRPDSYSPYPITSGGVTSPENKPATYLTTPKQGPSCTSPNCNAEHTFSGQHAPNPINSNYQPVIPSTTLDSNSPKCTSGNCNSQANSFPSYTNTLTEKKCSSPNCAPTPQNNYPQNNPTQTIPTAASNYKPSPPAPIFTSTISTPSGPSFSSNQFPKPNNVDKSSDALPAFVPLTPTGSTPCKGSDCNTSPSYQASPIGSNYPLASQNKPSHKNIEKPYTGGFGGPAGILKPSEFTTPNLPLNNKPAIPGYNSVPCASGNCNTGHNGNLETHTLPACTTGNCGSPIASSNIQVPVSKPLNQDSYVTPCLSGNCNNGQIGNVLGTYNTESCTTGNCNPQNLNVALNTKPTQEHHSISCTNGNCNQNPKNIGTPSGVYNLEPCKTGTCGINNNAPITNAKPAAQHTISGQHAPNPMNSNYQPVIPSTTLDSNSPKCTSGNCNSQANSFPSYTNTLTEKKCSSPNCAPTPQNNYPQNNPTQTIPTAASNYKPSPTAPIFTSTISTPSGPSFSSNQFPKPNNVDKSSDALPAFVPLIPTGSTPCKGSDCNASPSYQASPIGSNYPSASQNKPPHKNIEKPYTGGFGGPAGILKPSDFSTANLPLNNKPAIPEYNSVPCASGNCNTGHNGNLETHTLPACTTGNCGSPIASSNIQGPVSKPLNQDSNVKPCLSGNCNNGQLGNVLGTYNTESCTTGNCNPQNLNTKPTQEHHSISCINGNCNQNPTNIGTPSGVYNSVPCKTGTCGINNINNNAPITNGKPVAQHTNLPCSTGNCNYGQNGFGNPSGPTNTVTCTTGKCGPQDLTSNTHISTSHTGTVTCLSGNCNHQQNTNGNPTGSYNKTPCSSGNCGPQNTNSGTVSGASTAAAAAGVYKGGFGGPPGFLKPFDGGVNDKTVLPAFGGKYTNTHQNTGYANNPGGLSSTNVAGSTAGAFAAAGANAGTISGATHPNGQYNLNTESRPNGKSLPGTGTVPAFGGKYSNTQYVTGHTSNNPDVHSPNNFAGSSAGAFAAAGASAGAISGSVPNSHYNLNTEIGHKPEAGCSGGCTGSGSAGHGLSALQIFGLADGLNIAKAGGISGANAAAGGLGFGRSFASSGAVAHASSGAAVKGYGRR